MPSIIGPSFVGAVPASDLAVARFLLPAALLAALWIWETCFPLFSPGRRRLRHAGRNLAIAIGNAVVLALSLGVLTALAAAWTQEQGWGLLNLAALHPAAQLALAILLLDGWMYLWHRANHALPLLWRFHRMHHSDPQMDVTTATSFHIGEHVAGGILRLALIPLLGLGLWQILVYELMVTAVTQFHHANISLGRFDRWLRLLIVTPDMHKVHHSRRRAETDSNYATVFSFWDRLLRTFRRSEPRSIKFGLSQFDDQRWQTVWGMLRTPLAQSRPRDAAAQSSNDRHPQAKDSHTFHAPQEHESA